jgi:hypothetical protein
MSPKTTDTSGSLQGLGSAMQIVRNAAERSSRLRADQQWAGVVVSRICKEQSPEDRGRYESEENEARLRKRHMWAMMRPAAYGALNNNELYEWSLAGRGWRGCRDLASSLVRTA